MSSGCIIKREGKRGVSWLLKYDAGTDAATGKRLQRYKTIKGGTKKEAQAELRKLLGQVDDGTHVDPSKITVAEHVRARVAQWEAAGDIEPETAERYRELVENQIVPHIGAKLLQKLKAVDIEAWHTTLQTSGRKDGKGGVSNRTIGHAHRVLSKAIDEAVKHDLVSRNAAALEAPPEVDAEEIQIIPDDQIADLLAKLRGRPIYAKAVTALFTGMRRGELLALRWGNVDLDGKAVQIREALRERTKGSIRFKQTKTKAGRRDVTLPDIVVDALREHRKAQLEQRLALGQGKLPDDALVFPAPLTDDPQSPRNFSGEWADVAAAIGMGDVTLHALRHTHASQLIDAGVDIVTISKRLGHASPNVTLAIYAHLFRKRDDKAAAAINAALAQLGNA